jgi:hypothetical protein
MAYVISTFDLEDILVLLGESEWQMHILVRHPEVAPFLSDITNIIQRPDVRHRDPEDDRIILHYGQIPESRRLHQSLVYLLVVVKYVNAPERNYQKTGFISSVYFLKELKQRGEPL